MATDHRIDLIEHVTDLLRLTGYQSTEEIELLHAPPRTRPDLLKSWSLRSHPDYFCDPTNTTGTSVNAERIAVEILKIAERCADSFGGGTHAFIVRSSHQLSDRRVHRFALYPSTDATGDQSLTSYNGGIDGDLNAPLAPTERGVVGMLMRHIDNSEKRMQSRDQQFLAAIMHQANALREENNALRSAIEKRDQERREYIQAIDDARSREHEREIEALTVTSREERKTLTTKKIVGLFPVITSGLIRAVNKHADAKAAKAGVGANGTNGTASAAANGNGAASGAGANGAANGTTNGAAPAAPPAARSAIAVTVSTLLESLTVEQRASLQAILSLEQQIALSEIFETVNDEAVNQTLLPTMLTDLKDTITNVQMQAIMQLLSGDQRQRFLEAVTLAGAGATGPQGAAGSAVGVDGEVDQVATTA